jgi:hypothetical protein
MRFKKLENQTHARSFYFMHYNFAHIHHTLRVARAIEAGVTDRQGDLTDVVRVVDKSEVARKGEP